jgi:ATP-dependent RNA helicase DDX55/SPB4
MPVAVCSVGRTARAGRSGKAVVFLSESEDAYIPLLALHQVPIGAMPAMTFDSTSTAGEPSASAPAGAVDAAAVLEAMRQRCSVDRDALEKGTKAFISFLRGYGALPRLSVLRC